MTNQQYTKPEYMLSRKDLLRLINHILNKGFKNLTDISPLRRIAAQNDMTTLNVALYNLRFPELLLNLNIPASLVDTQKLDVIFWQMLRYKYGYHLLERHEIGAYNRRRKDNKLNKIFAELVTPYQRDGLAELTNPQELEAQYYYLTNNLEGWGNDIINRPSPFRKQKKASTNPNPPLPNRFHNNPVLQSTYRVQQGRDPEVKIPLARRTEEDLFKFSGELRDIESMDALKVIQTFKAWHSYISPTLYMSLRVLLSRTKSIYNVDPKSNPQDLIALLYLLIEMTVETRRMNLPNIRTYMAPLIDLGELYIAKDRVIFGNLDGEFQTVINDQYYLTTEETQKQIMLSPLTTIIHNQDVLLIEPTAPSRLTQSQLNTAPSVWTALLSSIYRPANNDKTNLTRQNLLR